jgi:hypothetical protein
LRPEFFVLLVPVVLAIVVAIVVAHGAHVNGHFVHNRSSGRRSRRSRRSRRTGASLMWEPQVLLGPIR